jgi:hypothetical protein
VSTRRQFIQTGAALAALGTISDSIANEPAQVHINLYKVIVDAAFAPSVAFGERAAWLGLTTHASPSDVTSLWYHDLHPRWMRSAAPIAGLTSAESLFCLERLAWDHSMRVLFKASHTALPGGEIQHSLTGPEAVVERLAAGYERDPRWASLTADALGRFPAMRARQSRRILLTAAGSVDSRFEGTLVSWVIGPVVETVRA